jgi:hypothetical protein
MENENDRGPAGLDGERATPEEIQAQFAELAELLEVGDPASSRSAIEIDDLADTFT